MDEAFIGPDGKLTPSGAEFFRRLLTQPAQLPPEMAKEFGGRVQKIYSEKARVEFGKLASKEAYTMPAWGVPGETPQEGQWPARDRVPFVADDALNAAIVSFDPGGEWHSLSPRGVEPRAIPIGAREAEVTPEMIAAGDKVHREYIGPIHDADLVDIYRAMHAVSPLPLVSDGELAAVRERDRERDNATHWELEARAAVEQRDEARAELSRLNAQPTSGADPVRYMVGEKLFDADGALVEVTGRSGPLVDGHIPNPWRRLATDQDLQIQSLRAELMAAHDKLAKLTVVPDPPKPAHDFTTDRRKMGW